MLAELRVRRIGDGAHGRAARETVSAPCGESAAARLRGCDYAVRHVRLGDRGDTETCPVAHRPRQPS
jgi:hypothetical protein